ncbi:hypothetical protein [Planococcus lenghuensis]|uniref:Lipoprotein n=1 Tax=Planococcus lenghuensis TaxID=2213202 RepID=A0A1Q2KY45_9BACL|nr:hypothetical protein [Planococcus lenghuensis]AQQ53145.1 hypothetical protein B0X71_08605 [Planococcus lenghuensis]
MKIGQFNIPGSQNIAANVKWVSLLLLIFLIASGCSPSKVTVRSTLNDFPDADIIQYEGDVFGNITDAEWFSEADQEEKVRYIGEIRKQTTNSWFFRDLYATQLPEGTKIYANSEENEHVWMLIAETEVGDQYYRVQLAE